MISAITSLKKVIKLLMQQGQLKKHEEDESFVKEQVSIANVYIAQLKSIKPATKGN